MFSRLIGYFERAPLSASTLFAIALLVRLAWWWASTLVGDYGFTTTDSHHYLRLAENLLHHGSFSLSSNQPLHPDFARTPGYPALLILMLAAGFSTTAIALFQVILGACIPVVVFITARHLSLAGSRFAALLVVLDLSLVVFGQLVLSELFFTLLLTIVIALLVVWRVHVHRWWVIGLLAGMLVMIRPVALFLLPIIALWWWVGAKNIKVMVLPLLCLLALPGGWSMRNYHHFNTTALSATGANTLYLFHAAGIKARAEGRSFSEVQRSFMDDLHGSFTLHDDPDAYRNYLRLARKRSWAIMREHPYEAASQSARHLVWFFIKPPRAYFDEALGGAVLNTPVLGYDRSEVGSAIRTARATTSPFAWAAVCWQTLINIISLMALLAGLRALWFTDKKLALLLALILAGFMISSTITLTDARMRVPVVPLMALAAAAAAPQWQRPKQKS